MSFRKDIKNFKDKAERAATGIFRGTALELFKRIIKRTPVGNPAIWERFSAPPGYAGGRLRANWLANINSAPQGTTSDKDKTGSKAIGQAAKVSGRAKLGDSIFLVNNLPYAGVIESGRHSKQAPLGMVRITVIEFKHIVRQLARKNFL